MKCCASAARWRDNRPTLVMTRTPLDVGIAIVAMAAVCVGAQLPAPEGWSRADVATRRLAPSAFADLPEALRAELDRRGCTIPQLNTEGRPHNVIRGAFRTPGERDVAVLCSRARTSAILVFWAGDPVVPARSRPSRMPVSCRSWRRVESDSRERSASPPRNTSASARGSMVARSPLP